jgi:hypothetical protein
MGVLQYDAQTGDPFNPKTKLTPTERKKVLLPAMFAPVININPAGSPKSKVFVTHSDDGING